jgi:hypothetical protein
MLNYHYNFGRILKEAWFIELEFVYDCPLYIVCLRELKI